MQFDKATKKQLLQIALAEDCSIDDKYRAVSELQMRWNEDMLTEIVIMYGKGYSPKEIADYLGVSCQVVGGVVSKYNLRRARNGLTKVVLNSTNLERQNFL